MSDQEMIILLHSMASDVYARDKTLSEELRQIAERLHQLSSKAADRRHWCGTE